MEVSNTEVRGAIACISERLQLVCPERVPPRFEVLVLGNSGKWCDLGEW